MYLSDYFLGRIGDLVAGKSLEVRGHTGEPGDTGLLNTALNNNGSALITHIASNFITRTGLTVDNDQELVMIQNPNSTSAGQTLTHLGYWLNNNFSAWVPLLAPYTILEGVPVSVPVGAIDFTAQLGT